MDLSVSQKETRRGVVVAFAIGGLFLMAIGLSGIVGNATPKIPIRNFYIALYGGLLFLVAGFALWFAARLQMSS